MPSAFGQTVASSGSSTSAYQFGATSGYRAEGDMGLTLVGCGTTTRRWSGTAQG